MVKTILSIIGEICGQILKLILPAIGEEFRKNNTVKQTGADDETRKDLDADIWRDASGVRMAQVRSVIHPDSRATPRRTTTDNKDIRRKGKDSSL